MDILESRLRQQEDSVNQLQTQLSTAQSQLQAARRESTDLRTQLADGTRTARVEQVSALGQVEGIELNRYLTGGLDRDGIPGDELLSVLIVPTDSQGNLVKAPGSVSLAVFDLSKPESQQRIGRWDFTPQKSDALWVSGFLGSGYVIRVPWQEAPQSASLLVHARLKTVDGRQFDTSQSIHIVPPNRARGASQSVAATSPKVRPEEIPAAPMPTAPAPSEQPPLAPPATPSAAIAQPLAKKDAPAETPWWDEAKSPATTGGDAPPQQIRSPKAE